MTGTGSFFEFTALVGLSSGNSFSDSLKALIIVFTAVFILIDGYPNCYMAWKNMS